MFNNFWCFVLFFRYYNVDVSVVVSVDFGFIILIVFNVDKKVSIKVKKMCKKRILIIIWLGNVEVVVILLIMIYLGVKWILWIVVI